MNPNPIHIIGSGLAGTLLALTLEQANVPLNIISSPELTPASRIAAGLINPITGKRLTQTAHLEQLLPFAVQFYRKLESQFNTSFLTERPLVRLLKNKNEATRFRERLTDPTYQPFIGTVYPPKSLAYTYNGHGGFEIRQVYLLNVPKLLTVAHDYFKSRGILSEHTYKQETLPGQTIFCNGAYLQTAPAFSWLPFKPAKGEILHLKLAQPIPTTILNQGQWIIPTPDEDLSLPTLHARIGSTYAWDCPDTLPSGEGKTELLGAYSRMIHNAPEPTITDHTAAIRPCTQDSKPFIGMHPHHPNLGLFNGFGSKGTLCIPYYAHVFTEHLIHSAPLPSDVCITRYAHHLTPPTVL